MLYPLKFKPILMSKIWGGQILKSLYNDGVALDNIGESWLLSEVEGKESIVSEGFLKDNNLSEIVEVYLNDLLGDSVYGEYDEIFPLLVKIIDAAQDLSIQVHPNDEIAKKYHNSLGKNEMWYILNATDEAFIYAGFNRPITKDEYLEAVSDNTIEKYLKKYHVKKGDYIYIPAGCVHAIGRGCTILEIQQSSDVTYRIWDYNRRDKDGNLRELHTDMALETIDFDNWQSELHSSADMAGNIQKLLDSEFFKVSSMSLSRPQELNLTDIDSFVILSVVEGELDITYPEGNISLSSWETTLIPASMSNVIFVPKKDSKILITYIKS